MSKHPEATITVRELEKIILTYLTITAGLFLFYPDLIAAPVYIHWQSWGQTNWGLFIAVLCATHWSALFWNGRNPIISRTLRCIALALYAIVSIRFGINFIQGGAVWGAGLYLCLLPLLVRPMMTGVISEIMLHKEGN